MAISHFTLPACPNCGQPEDAVGDPNYNRWHCFHCQANGSWEYSIDGDDPAPDEPVEAA